MALTTTTVGTARGVADTGGFAFQNRNNYDLGLIAIGRDGKFGLFRYAQMKWVGLPIPARARILSAVVRHRAQTTDATAFTVNIGMLHRDGVWNPDTSPAQWRVMPDRDHKVRLETTASGTMVETITDPLSAQVGVDWELHGDNASAPGRFQRLSQSVTIVTGGTLGFAQLTIRRTGAVAGTLNLWAEIYSIDPPPIPIFNDEPGTLLATSDPIDASSVSASLLAIPPTQFTFSGGDQITLVAGTKYAIVLRASYAAPFGGNWISWSGQNVGFGGPYSGGRGNTYGSGNDFDDQNYPQDFNLAALRAAQTGSDVLWTPPATTAWTEFDTLDIASIVQEYVNDPAEYDGDGTFGITYKTASGALGVSRIFDPYEGVLAFQPRLIVTWRPRNMGAVWITAPSVAPAERPVVSVVSVVADSSSAAGLASDSLEQVAVTSEASRNAGVTQEDAEAIGATPDTESDVGI